MSSSTLAAFIDRERVAIVDEWETFARSLSPASDGMNARALRDHADEILTAIVEDMNSQQTAREQRDKSLGRLEGGPLGMISKIHAELRLESGFNLDQVVAEYRALRASVLRLWPDPGADAPGICRFNEAIDEALAEAVTRYTETTSRYRDQSIGILSHDLRNPLQSIILGSRLLKESSFQEEPVMRIAERISRSAGRMDRMICDLLDLTRTRFGQGIPVVPVSMDLVPICTQVIDELELSGRAGSIRFCPQGDLQVEWDGDRIAQLISNLVRNAIQHGAEGGVVELRALDRAWEVWIEVHNEGPAIPETHVKTIFDPMIRHVADRPSSGLGLGLFIASQVALAHGGSLSVSSTSDDGTTFSARLPRRARCVSASV